MISIGKALILMGYIPQVPGHWDDYDFICEDNLDGRGPVVIWKSTKLMPSMEEIEKFRSSYVPVLPPTMNDLIKRIEDLEKSKK